MSAKLWFLRHAPKFLTGLGVAGAIGGSIWACKATYDMHPIFEEAKEQIAELRNKLDEAKEENKKEVKKELRKAYLTYGGKIAKGYALPAIVEGASVAGIVSSSVMQEKRIGGLAAAYSGLSATYAQYRKSVAERLSQEEEEKLYYNAKTETVKENGKKKEVTNIETDRRHNHLSRVFDSGCIGWEKNAEYNRKFVQNQLDAANALLNYRGFLVLNEVYVMFGFPKTKEGQVVGWIKEKGDPDNKISFGIYSGLDDDPAKRNFVNGCEYSVVLDFNVDGYILDRIQYK